MCHTFSTVRRVTARDRAWGRSWGAHPSTFGVTSPLSPRCLPAVSNPTVSPLSPPRCLRVRATRERLNPFQGLEPEIQGQNLTLTVLYVPCFCQRSVNPTQAALGHHRPPAPRTSLCPQGSAVFTSVSHPENLVSAVFWPVGHPPA